MPESPEHNEIVPDDPPIPGEYPSADEAEPEHDDTPMGPPPDADPAEQPMPGVPVGDEPPDAG